MAVDPKKALRDMMNGVLTEESLALATQSKKIEVHAENENPVTPIKKHNSYGNSRGYDEDRFDQIDLLAEAKKKLAHAQRMGGDAVFLEGSPVLEQKEVPTNAIEMLLAGKGKEAKKIVKESTPIPTRKQPINDEFDPLEAYSNKTQNARPLINEEYKNDINISKEEIKSLITEILFEDLIGEGKFKKMIVKVMKDELKPALKELMISMKKS